MIRGDRKCRSEVEKVGIRREEQKSGGKAEALDGDVGYLGCLGCAV
jgi:hypothetical protein